MTWKKPWMVLSDSPRSCCSARKRLSSKAVSASRFWTPLARKYQSSFCSYHLMVRGLRPITFSSSSHSRINGFSGCSPPRGLTLSLGTSPSMATADSAAGDGATLGGRPRATLLGPKRGDNGLRKPIRFWGFFHSFEPPSPLSEHPPYRCPKTTKTGLAAGLLNSNYQQGPLSESVAERERFELSMGQ